MKKNTLLISLFLFIGLYCFGQKLSVENTYAFESLNKNSYLGNVEYDQENQTTKLYYVAKDMTKTVFTTYVFDDQLNFVEEQRDEYSIIDASIDAINSVRTKYEWFNYRGEEYTQEVVWILPSWKGEIVARKVLYTYKYYWGLGSYYRTFKVMDKQTISGIDGGRLFLYDRIDNSLDGSVLILVGLKADKADKENKWQEARKFQFIKITSNFEAIPGDIIEFDYDMGISFTKVLSQNTEIMETEGGEGEGTFTDYMEHSAGDLADGDAVLIFAPVKSMMDKKHMAPDPGAHTMLILNAEGKIENRIDYKTPTSGWVVEGYTLSPDGKDIYFFGPAKDEAYVNMLMPVNTPFGSSDAVAEIKWKNFQVMKVSGNEVAYLNSTPLADFKAKAVNPPSQKKSPDYIGKNFEKSLAYVTPGGELIISGQKYTTTNVPDPNSNVQGATKTVIDEYKDLVMFHFDAQGVLKAQYGIRRDKNNKYSKANLTPQDVYVSGDGNLLYWVYGEIQGMRKGFEIGTNIAGFQGSIGVSKKKLLYYPAVSRIDLANASVGDFVPLGTDTEGKQLYYTNPEFPQLLSGDQTNLTFVGEDKPGKLIWLGRMMLE